MVNQLPLAGLMVDEKKPRKHCCLTGANSLQQTGDNI